MHVHWKSRSAETIQCGSQWLDCSLRLWMVLFAQNSWMPRDCQNGQAARRAPSQRAIHGCTRNDLIVRVNMKACDSREA